MGLGRIKKKYQGNQAEIVTKINKLDVEDRLAIEGMKDVSAYRMKEGLVERIEDEFDDDVFHLNLRKFVRKGHVQTDEHWTRSWKRQKLSFERKIKI